MSMASNLWQNLLSLKFSGFKPYLEAGAGWFIQVKDVMKVLMMVYNPLSKHAKASSPRVTHKIKMASFHMSMDEVSKTYKITPVRRL